jgi:hypothetical protein
MRNLFFRAAAAAHRLDFLRCHEVSPGTMRTFRLILFAYFLIQAVLCAATAIWSLAGLLNKKDTAGDYALELALILLAAMFGMACRALWRQQASGKSWVTVASVVNLAASAGPLVFYLSLRAAGIIVRGGLFTRAGGFALIPLVFGIAGLFAFPRARPADQAARTACP